MKQPILYLGALVCEVVALIALWFGRAVLATDWHLMLFVSVWVLMGLLLALKTDTQEALGIIVKLRPGDVLNGLRSTDPKVVVKPEEKP